MNKYASHTVAPTGPADLDLAMDTAQELDRAPRPTEPAPVVPAPQLMGLRMPAARPHVHKVPLRRLTAVRG